METMRELVNWILEKDAICVIPHVSPDGDAIGSALALKVILEKMGKRACVACTDAVPLMYGFLPLIDQVVHPDALPFEPDGLLFDDVAAYDRAGDRSLLSNRITDWALIDHHETNPGFARVNVVDSAASATGLLVFRLLNEVGVALDTRIALLLYAAISTDTGNFSFSNTSAEALNAAACLLGTGFDLDDTNRRLFRLRSVPRARLLGMALAGMELYAHNRLAVARITQEMFDICGAEHAHTEGIVSALCDMEGIVAAMTVEAREDGKATKFSLRSTGEVDVAAIARSFGGGGHKNAAGMNLDMTVEEAAPLALEAVLRALDAL